MKYFLHIQLTLSLILSGLSPAQTVARQWNDENLAAIRIDFPAPTVHARNLFFLSGAMHDAWAAFDPNTVGYFYNEEFVVPAGQSIQDARNEAISYAAYQVLSNYYQYSTNSATSQTSFDTKMSSLGYSTSYSGTTGTTAADLGNRVAAAINTYSLSDEASQNTFPGYLKSGFTYTASNAPLSLILHDTTSGFPNGWNDMNRWQPLAFNIAFTQNGQIASNVQSFVSPHWGGVKAFGLSQDDMNSKGLYFDPGDPPYIGGVGDLEYKDNAIEVLHYSTLLDPTANEMIDISPRSRGNNTLGLNDGTGYSVNPATGLAYPTNIVNHADYGRCLAEFWADGPDSETPPGHWNVLANEVMDEIEADPSKSLQLEGTGPTLDRLEYEVKLYLALNAALHNTAVSVWGIKEHYDYVRPISAIRYMCKVRQYNGTLSSEHLGNDIPLVPDLVEEITATTAATGGKHDHLSAHIGKIAVHTWPGEPNDPSSEWGGREWILGEHWLPYQRDTFVTPAFAGYVSGHSGFSRAAAEVMTLFTGDKYFPGGIKTHTVPAGALHFEFAPSVSTTLQWATYYDAADEAGLSRLYGGIHVSPDDGPGRIVGSKIGVAAFNHAKKLWDDSINESIRPCIEVVGANCELAFDFCVPGYDYELRSSTTLTDDFTTVVSPAQTATEHRIEFTTPATQSRCFYRLERTN